MNKIPARDNDEYRAKKNRYGKEHRDEMNRIQNNWKRKKRIEILDFLGGVCVVCGEMDWRCLQIDHVNGHGKRDKSSLCEYHNLGRFYSDIRIHPEKYQVLCANHNWIKRYELNETRSRKD